jgi:3-deoxy-D-manno-octulosonate 8-phosphate phosphatase (KDO 8-P phosphatase)
MPPIVSTELAERAKKIRMVLMDVDGVLTDGRVWFLPGADGGIFETKGFDSQDGIAMHWLKRYGYLTGIISGRIAQATAERARQAKFDYVYMGNTEKLGIFEEILEKSGCRPEEVAYLGDDLTDAILMKRVGFAVAVGNARPEVKAIAHYVTQARGGEGALREASEILFDARGVWSEILAHYEVDLPVTPKQS